MADERKSYGFGRFGGLRLDLPIDEVGGEEAIFARDVDWDGALGKVRCRDGFQKLKAAEATGPYKGLAAHSATRLLAVKRINSTEVKIVAIDRTGAELVEAAWTKEAAKSTFARFGTPSASYTYARAAFSTHKVVRFDGAAFTEPTAAVDGVGGKEMPRGAFMATWPAGGNRLVVANTAATGGPNAAASSASHVWFSDPGNAESWHTVAPEASYAQLSPGDGEEITALVVFGGAVFVFKETKFFVFYGVSLDNEGAPSFDFREVNLGEGNRMKRASSEALAETSDQIATSAPTGVYFCTTDGIYVTTGGEPAKISNALKPLEETTPFDGPMAAFLNGSTETCRWPAAGIVALGQRLVVKRAEFLFVYDIPTGAWTCWKQPSVSLAVWVGLNSSGGAAALERPPGTMADDATVGAVAWASVNNAKAADGAYATVKLEGEPPILSHYLKATNFGFAIPEGATIAGIVAEVKLTCENKGSISARESRVRIIKGGAIGAAERATAELLPFTPTVVTYGGNSDLWGNTWTPADINGSTFGLALSYASWVPEGTDTETGAFVTPKVDSIVIKVYYSMPEVTSGRPRLFVTSGKFIFWTGPSAEEHGTTREAMWQSGFYDFGNEDEKDLVETKIFGAGTIGLSSYRDFASEPGYTDSIAIGTTLGQGRSHSSHAATLFSHRITLAAGASIQRLVRYLRESPTATTRTNVK